VRVALRQPDLSVLQRPDGPRAAVEFLARHAGEGTRVFNDYNDGPWLLWGAPRVKHYIDPRNNLGGESLLRYLELTVQPDRFEEEVRRLGITLAFLDLRDQKMSTLVRHLDLAADWVPVYLDGHHGVYARGTAANSALIERLGYSVLRGHHTVRSLTSREPADAAKIARDLVRLARQSPTLAAVLEPCREILAGQPASQERVRELIQAFQAPSIQRLPPSAYLIACYGAALQAGGQAGSAKELLKEARATFAKDATLEALFHQD